MEIIWFLIIGGLAGCFAGMLTGNGGFGIIADIILGIIGAVVGGYLLGSIGIFESGVLGQLITATVGAVVILLIFRLFSRR
ncbi:MAG: GlsB/YeaQ/YmgE family stress response membrane protein [Pirellulaceae bacterium]|nr:GlsB/YeaQ/YmgE family stress response membrane protein [Pirellulaceae bacterium]